MLGSLETTSGATEEGVVTSFENAVILVLNFLP
jgi:hypothetical protein